MDGTLPNKYTKFGAKIFMSYWVITFLVLGHFFKPHPVYMHFYTMTQKKTRHHTFVDIFNQYWHIFTKKAQLMQS